MSVSEKIKENTRCLYCGKVMDSEETNNDWHRKCIKKFFATDTMPFIELTDEQLQALANDIVNKGITIPGVQKKMSLHLSRTDGISRLTVVDYPTGYILKPQTELFDSLPEYEDMAMRMAEAAKIKTVPHALIRLKDQYAYITKRIDRNISRKDVKLYAMEDFCQLGGRLTEDKYKGSYEHCVKIAKKYSSRPGIDASEILIRVIFSFIIGNSDMHLKNFSLIETEPGKREYVLSSAYDFLPVNVIMPSDQEQFALTMNGKKRNIHKNDFIKFAANFGMSKPAALKIINHLCKLKDKYFRCVEDSYLDEDKKEKVRELIEERIHILQQ